MPEGIGEKPKENPRFQKAELEAHEFRAFKRKDSEFLEAFFMTIRSDPQLWDEIKAVVARREDFKEGTVKTGELHRVGVELFSGINLNPEAALLYDTALRDATLAESNFLKDSIDAGNAYAPLVVIGGGGVHATIFSGALLKYNPLAPAFGLEAQGRRGGTFGATGDPAGFLQAWFELNSRNRPEDRDTPGFPGTKGNINPLGTWANLQLPDVSGEQYATQEKLGRVIAHDNFNSLNLAVNAKVVRLRPQRDRQKRGTYEIEFEDTLTGRRRFVQSDILVQTTGLGEETFAVDIMSPKTRDFIASERGKFEEGMETPLLFTPSQFLEWTTSGRTSFPLEDFRQGIGLIGSGDSAKVIIEYLVGVAGTAGKSSSQIDFIPEVKVIGSFEQLKESLIQTNRCRYARGFLEFMREDETVFARVSAVSGRVAGFEEAKEGVAVLYERDDNTIGTMVVPRLIAATGFKDKSAKIYEGLEATIIDSPQEILARAGETFRESGSVLWLKRGAGGAFQNIARIEIGAEENRFHEESQEDNSQRIKKVIPLTLISSAGETFKAEFFPEEEDISPQLISQIARIEIPGAPPQFSPFSDARFGDEISIGERVEGRSIYRIGGATRYPLTEEEKSLTPTFGRVPENTKAIARFKFGDERLAYLLSREVNATPGALNTVRYEAKRRVLPALGESAGEARGEIVVSAQKKDANRMLPRDIRSEIVIKYLVGSRLTGQFPEDVSELRFLVRREGDAGESGAVRYIVSIQPPVPSGGGWEVIDDLFQDALMQRSLAPLTKVFSTNAAFITVPVENGLVDSANITVRAVDRKGISRLRRQDTRRGVDTP